MSRSRVRYLALTTAAAAAAVLAVASPAHAEDGSDPAVTAAPGTQTPAQIVGEALMSANDPVAAARDYLAGSPDTFVMGDVDANLTPVGTYAADGTETVRFAQNYRGVPVFGAQYLVHMRPTGDATTVTGANGSYYSNLDLDTTAAVTADRAAQQAKAFVQEALDKDVMRAGEYRDTARAVSNGVVVMPTGTGVLAYHVTVSTVDAKTGAPLVKEVYVDADTAWPLLAYDGIQMDSPVQGTGVKADGGEVPLGLTAADDGTYRLTDQSNSPTTINTYDGRGADVSAVLGGGVPDGMPVFSGPSTRFDGEATESGAVDAHANAAHVYEYYRGLGRNGLDGNGMNMDSIVGVTDRGRPFVNAFWDGSKMVYGGGDAEYRTLSADLDVVGHEMTHGVVEHSANLVYAHQSGAMNEAIADYFGNAIDVDVTGTSMRDPNAGLLGEDLCRTMGPRECALRDLNDGRTTADYEGLTWEFDNGGVHMNSTIFSGALWDIRETIGKDKADRLIYKALTEYMTPLDDFVDGRNAVMQAAKDMRLSFVARAFVYTAFLKHGIVDGWEKHVGDAKVLMDIGTVIKTGPAAAGGWWVGPKGTPDGSAPYAMYSGRTDGRGEPIKLSDPIGGRFNVYAATDGTWAAWIAWGAADALIYRAPVDGSAPAQLVGYARNPQRLSVDGDWITWTEQTPSGLKQWYMNATVPGSETPVDPTYYKQSGLGQVRDGKLYYILNAPSRPDNVWHLNVAVRDLATGAETLLPEFMSADGTQPAGIYGPKVTDGHVVIGVDQIDGPGAAIMRMDLDDGNVKTLVAEDESNPLLLGDYDATETAVSYENWPGVSAPKIWQVGIDGGKALRVSCSNGVQFRMDSDEGKRVVFLDGTYGGSAIVARDKAARRC